MAQAAIKPNTEYKRRKKRAIDFSSHRNKSSTFRAVANNPKPDPVRYEDVFSEKHPWKRTTGEEILIIRSFMHMQGLPEIPEHFTIPQFASAMQWYLRPRYAWQHFYGREITEARRFISEWARVLLPRLSEV